jgi:hypothetical protein
VTTTRIRRLRRAAAPLVVLALLGLALPGCQKVRRGFADACYQEENDFESAQAKRNGMQTRGLRQSDPAFRDALAQERRARSALRSCQARYG